ncbi:MAG: S41 family peptidase [Microscillaceae bacterium]|nr:S41 family peptidase [Microscillaceae bacterium]
MIKKKFNKSTLLILLFISISLFAFKANYDRYFEIQKNLDIFTTLFKEVNRAYVDEVNPNTLMKTGIDAMLNSLDPYTNYIPEDEIEDYRTLTTGQYGGIGALVGNRNGKTVIIMPYEGFPAQEAGLRIGDEILKIDGITLNGKNNDEVSKLLKGQANTKVRLEIKSFGDTASREVVLTRENIKLDDVPYYGMVSSEIGYLKLTDFRSGAAREVTNAITEMKGKGAKKIILDLRDNPGGLLSEAVNISNLFINKDLEVVSTKGKSEEWNKTYKALNSPLDAEIPVVVLTNNRSASASEIVSGVIQDYDRGLLVGQKTFGKGLVQATHPLSYNSQLKVTTAKYYIPSGRCIQALDYSHRNADGSVDKIADSLKTAFRTKNGRTVYDGAGVDPDLFVEPNTLSSITRSLLNKSLIFDYASVYFHKHEKIAPAKEFKLSDAEYQAFVQWLQGKEYDYTTQVEESILQVEQKAKEEKYYNNIKSQLDALKVKVSHNKDSDLQNFKDEIKAQLEEEIVSRYYYERGKTEVSFNHDPELKAAIELLQDTNRYNKILKGLK